MLASEKTRQSDPIVLSRLQASAALQRLNREDAATEASLVYFMNIARLIQMYRFGTLGKKRPAGVLEVRTPDSTALSRDSDSIARLKESLTRAIEGLSEVPEDLERLETTFSSLSACGIGEISQKEKEFAEEFLVEFLRVLTEE